MAKITWEIVKKHLDKTYKTNRTDNDMVKITFVYPDANNRTQLVLVDHEQQKERLVVEIVSRVGQIATSRLPAVLEYIGKKYFVGLEKMGDYYYTRVSLDMRYVPLEAIGSMVELVCRTADSLEKDFVGGDVN